METKQNVYAALFAAVLCFGLVGCVTAEMQSVRALAIAPVDLKAVPDGVHVGSFAYGSFTYRVEVATMGGSIVSAKATANRTTSHALKAQKVLDSVVAQQRVDVDVMSGATTTSKALLKAVENALTGN